MDGNNAIASDIDSLKRTKGINKQTALSFLFQGASTLLNFLVVPITIKFLDQEVYGIWITLLSIISWISLMDLGIGLGLRNKLTECLANNDVLNARKYISTAYLSISLVMIPILVIGLSVFPFLNWNSIFNIKNVSNSELSRSVSLILIGMIAAFTLGLVNQIFNALQKNAFVALHPIILNSGLLIVLYFQPQNHINSLLLISLTYVVISVSALLLISIWIFNKNRVLIPRIKYYDKTKVRSLLSLGIKFFVIQIAVLIIFSTDNIVITQVFGPKLVTPYQVVRQAFGIVSILATLVMSPLWSAYTDAYVKNDMAWIKRRIKMLSLLFIPVLIGVGIIIYFFNDIMTLWIKQKINIPPLLILFMALYTVISIWNSIFSIFLNGIGKISISLYICIFSGLINIPLTIFFAKKFGLSGVMLGTIISLLPALFILPYQTYLLINNKSIGIWSR